MEYDRWSGRGGMLLNTPREQVKGRMKTGGDKYMEKTRKLLRNMGTQEEVKHMREKIQGTRNNKWTNIDRYRS